MELHCAAEKPGLAPLQNATAPGPYSAFDPVKDAMPAVDKVPSANTLGRCWVSFPAPKNLPLEKPAVPVEMGYGRPDWSCPIQLRPRSLVNQRRPLVFVTFPESNITPMLAAWRISLNAGPNSARMFLGSPGSESPKKSSPEVSACDHV